MFSRNIEPQSGLLNGTRKSFDKISVYLPTPVLQHGMIYVAFCRCKNPNNLKIFVHEIEENINNDHSIYTKNIVFLQLFD
ncbi:hypothetical protein DERF_002854 [Dermatophagoides farinae]|uniref:Uncharacterized protein n=1 Tax=Dermatophagoides farinae TaxID=6954 RepID=A0A922HRW8_DERFA|nr:hypothetical protein DERF_012099 [Dermatophagoides farinae]KAH9528945.1 hypothetical protein DERF_002854 [Dermatophagoides farinae]